MALRDTAGRLLSRLQGTAARNRYASAIQQKIDAVKATQAQGQSRVDRGLGQIKRQREAEQGFADLRRQIRQDQQKAFEQAKAEIGALPTGEPALGEDFSGENWNAPWIPVASSNVESIRWVGGNWGLQVRFKNGYWYEYYTSFQQFEAMRDAPSKGKFVWGMRYSKVPYHRLAGGKGPRTLAYQWGRALGGKAGRELIRNPNFPRRKLR